MLPVQAVFEGDQPPELLVGLSSPDDAAVWRLDDSRVLVVTTDFFTPVVDDPYAFGAIAAANSLSDIYAMGAKSFLALNVAAMPADLDPAIIQEIMRGGAEKVREAGAIIAGGHSVQDKEPKYGLVALGMIEEQDLITKAGAAPGEALILTKPLGTGVTTTALIRDKGTSAHEAEVIEWMTQLNESAAELAQAAGVRAATDVTGFGLIGHALEMAQASEVRIEFALAQVPFLSGARHYAELGTFPGGSLDNRSYFAAGVEFDSEIEEPDRMLLFDAQTSGGLLLAVPGDSADGLLTMAEARRVPAWRIGRVLEGSGVRVRVEF